MITLGRIAFLLAGLFFLGWAITVLVYLHDIYAWCGVFTGGLFCGI